MALQVEKRGQPLTTHSQIALDFGGLVCYSRSTMEVGTLVRRAPERGGWRLHNHVGTIVEVDGSQHCKVIWMNRPNVWWLTAFDLLELV